MPSHAGNLNSLGFIVHQHSPGNPFSRSTIPPSRVSFRIPRRCCCSCNFQYYFGRKLSGSRVRRYGSISRHGLLQVRAMDEDTEGFSSFNDWGETVGAVSYVLSSSDGEDSDGEIILQPIPDVDLPTTKEQFLPADDSVAVTAHRLALLGARKKRKSIYGVLNNVGLITFLTLFILLVDHCAWRIVRMPLAPFYLTRPFLMSAFTVSCVGYICVPLFRSLKLQSLVRKKARTPRCYRKGTPTMGGLYFIPIGIIIAEAMVRFSSIEVAGAAAATLAFAAIGILDDILGLESNNGGLPFWSRIFLEVAVGAWFSYWLYATHISSPYGMKMVVPLPAPLGLLCLAKIYPFLTSFCFASMANGINLTDGLDGLAGGTAALVLVGMSIAVLPMCADLAIFGVSMAGACVGFLLHNRYKASIFMGNTGALALGGALAAMASCTGMFLPLFISSGVFVIEALSVILQVSFFKSAKYIWGSGRRLFQTAPFHRHLELCGIKEPVIVATAYVITCVLMLFGAYVGLTSV